MDSLNSFMADQSGFLVITTGIAFTFIGVLQMILRNDLLNGPLGFGAAPLGNMFRNIPDAEAEDTVDAAWDEGTRYFDTAPFYGAGLSEIRLGQALAKRNRNEYRLSTKVGRIILDEVGYTSNRLPNH